MDSFDSFKKKVELLIKSHSTLKSENSRLRATIEGQNKVIQSLNRKVRSLEEQMVSVDLKDAGLDEAQRDDMKKQLDIVIGEIDNILSRLND